MAFDALACLIAKIEDGTLDRKAGKELLMRSKAMEGHFPGDPNRAVRVATEQFNAELEKQALKLNRFVKNTAGVAKNLETLPQAEAKLFITEALGQRLEYSKRGLMDLYMRHFKGEKLSKAENMEVLRALTGESPSKAGTVNDVVTAIRKGNETIRRSMAEFGEAGVEAPKNHVQVFLPSGKVAGVTQEEFIKDMNNLNLDYLVENTPYFHKIEGGLQGYLEKMYRMLLEGPSMHRDLKWGVSASDAIATFKKSLYAGSSDTYLKFNAKYGAGRLNLMSDYVYSAKNASEYVGRMAAYGGDVKRYRDFLAESLDKKGFLDGDLKEYLDSWARFAAGETDQWSHRNKVWEIIPGHFSVRPAAFLSSLKAASMVKVNIGGVFGALFGDLATINKSMKQVGFKTSYTPEGLWTAIKGDKDLAGRMALSTEWMVDRITEQTRFAQEDLGSQFANKIASVSSKISGLDFLTRLHRENMMFDIMYQMANLPVKYEELDSRMLRSFNFAEIGPKEWAELKAFKWPEGRGGVMMDPGLLANSNLPLARKLTAFKEHMKENGIPTNGIAKQKVKKELIKGRGPVAAGLVESSFIFQGWSSSMFENHLRPAFVGRNRLMFAKLAAFMALAEVVNQTLTNTSKGETTNFEDPELYTKAFFKSGAFSIFGDVTGLAFEDYKNLEGFTGEKVLGVTFGTMADIGQTIYRNGKKAIKGDKTRVGYDLLRIAEGYNPASKIWWTRKLYDEVIGRHIRRMVDPKETRKADKRLKQRLRKEGRKLF